MEHFYEEGGMGGHITLHVLQIHHVHVPSTSFRRFGLTAGCTSRGRWGSRSGSIRAESGEPAGSARTNAACC